MFSNRRYNTISQARHWLGVFNTSYGLALLGGATLMGLLYDMNKIGIIIAFTCIVELLAIILYFKMDKMIRDNSHQVKY
ncbi:MAG: hypothetical protein LC127_09270 [Chitinophagales bacterium]|nr:hypothetical protein [Chitinophagales bacterium]